MSNDPLAALNSAGLQQLPAEMRAVFENLSPEELRVATAIQERLNAVTPEVEGQGTKNNCLC